MNRLLRMASVALALGAGALPALAGPESNKEIALGLLQQGLVQGNRDFIQQHVTADYIQHNPQAADGRQGLLEFTGFLETLDPPIAITPVRAIAEGDFVVVHHEAQFFGPKVIIDLFRFEGDMIAEHWDGIQERVSETASGRSMTDGPTQIVDLDRTEANKALVTSLVRDVLMNGETGKIDQYIASDYRQHNPFVADTRAGLKAFIQQLQDNDVSFGYTALHHVVAEGNFVFTQAEGIFDGVPTAFYDIWRVQDGMVVEHWDTVQTIPETFAHENGMF